MKRIVIVGVGALGSHATQFLRSVPDTSLKVIDFDRVESKNTQSQFLGMPGIGKPKVSALAQQMHFLFNRKVDTVPHRLTAENGEALLGDAALVLDCLDNGASRRLVQGFVRQYGIPCIHGGLAADGAYGRVVWDERFQIDDEPGAGVATCEDGAFLPFVGIVSAYLAEAARLFLVHGQRVNYEIAPSFVRSSLGP